MVRVISISTMEGDHYDRSSDGWPLPDEPKPFLIRPNRVLLSATIPEPIDLAADPFEDGTTVETGDSPW